MLELPDSVVVGDLTELGGGVDVVMSDTVSIGGLAMGCGGGASSAAAAAVPSLAPSELAPANRVGLGGQVMDLLESGGAQERARLAAALGLSGGATADVLREALLSLKAKEAKGKGIGFLPK